MPFKMKGFPMMKGTGAMKAMKESAMKKMHASPKKAMKDPMKKMKDPMKAMKDPMKAMHASPKKRMKGGMKPDPDYYKKGNFMDTKKSEQERIDKKAYGPEGAPATVKPKKGRDTLTTAIPQSTIGKKLKDKAKKETVKSKVPPPGVKRRIVSKIKKIDRKLLNPNENRPKYGSAKKAMKESPKKAMSPKKRMTGSKTAEARKAVGGKDKVAGAKANAAGVGAKGVKQRNMTKTLKTRFVDTNKKSKKMNYIPSKTNFKEYGSPKKAMSPKKKTIAKDKDPKFKKSNRRSQAEFEPMYEGADISRAQFNRMSKREQRRYIKTQTD